MSALTLTSSTVSHNTASGDGGGLEVYSGTLTLTEERDHRVPYAFVITGKLVPGRGRARGDGMPRRRRGDVQERQEDHLDAAL